MADLVRELEQLLDGCPRSARSNGGSYSARSAAPGELGAAPEPQHEAKYSKAAGDPLLLDPPYSLRRHDTAASVSPAAAAGGARGGAAGSWALDTDACSGGGVGASAEDAGPATSPGVAALEAYKQQWWRSAVARTRSGSAAGGAGGGALQAPVAGVETRPDRGQLGSGAAGAAVPAPHPILKLSSRPAGGAGPADFGPGHVPGRLARPSGVSDAMIPSLPPKSGTGFRLPPPRLHERSCVPPPQPEPLAAPAAAAAAAAAAAERDALRAVQAGDAPARLVYDSLVPPDAAVVPQQQLQDGSACGGGWQAARAADGSGGYAPGLDPWYVPESADDTTLVFESRFESGNLRRAIQVSQYEYDLVLQPDINTRGHTQWFFFAVSNTRAGQAYRFNLVNLLKADSLYNAGMLPLVHSERRMAQEGVGWARGGSGVCYYGNCVRARRGGHYWTLTFTLTLPHSWDTVHVAHCYPYTFTDLQRGLAALRATPAAAARLARRPLCASLAGNDVDLLTLTAAPGDAGAAPLERRRGVVLTARVHPGETNASWMMKGATEFLLGPSAEAAALRGAFVFKIVPMLNPDGVVVGNYRCSLAGLDLNREYLEPGAPTPTIRALKDMTREFMREREVVLLCDLHGHSRKFGVFAYGCDKGPKDAAPAAPGWPPPGSLGGLPGAPGSAQARLFPLMLHLNAPDLFCYKSCNFAVQKAKAGTGRVVAFRELGLVNAFTLEASFAGAAAGRHAGRHFNAGHLEEMGAAVVRTLCDYWAPESTSCAAELVRALEMTAPGDGQPPLAYLVQTPDGLALVPADEDASGASAGSGSDGPGGGGAGAGADGGATDSDDESSEDEPRPRPAACPATAVTGGGAAGGGGAADASGWALARAASRRWRWPWLAPARRAQAWRQA